MTGAVGRVRSVTGQLLLNPEGDDRVTPYLQDLGVRVSALDETTKTALLDDALVIFRRHLKVKLDEGKAETKWPAAWAGEVSTNATERSARITIDGQGNVEFSIGEGIEYAALLSVPEGQGTVRMGPFTFPLRRDPVAQRWAKAQSVVYPGRGLMDYAFRNTLDDLREVIDDIVDSTLSGTLYKKGSNDNLVFRAGPRSIRRIAESIARETYFRNGRFVGGSTKFQTLVDDVERSLRRQGDVIRKGRRR